PELFDCDPCRHGISCTPVGRFVCCPVVQGGGFRAAGPVANSSKPSRQGSNRSYPDGMDQPAISTAASRPDLFRRASELTADLWPVYNTHGDVLSLYWAHLEEAFPQFQFTVHDANSEDVLAQGHTIPCVWD